MIENLLKELEQGGKLRRQKKSLVQIESLLKEAILDLKEAHKICAIAERATYILAYMAMLKAGKALLLSLGFVPDDGAQHKTVVEITAAVLGGEYRDLTGKFELMRRKRNEITYESGFTLSAPEAQKAFKDSIRLVEQILATIKKANPQLEMDFDIE